tara:strand:- start:60485 stop:61393 length:909 start_codon:yes stop_codon:yes gene_type:complete
MLLRIFIVKLLILLSLASNAQELNAEVQVLSPAIQRTNKQVFNTLETAIRQFLNTRKWTSEKYAQEEKINCSFIINMTKWDGNDNFEGTLQIQYSRPIYKSTYQSPLFVHMDQNFQFNYLEFDRLDFSENTSLSNLTSILAYYVYIIIGMDHDSYAMKGGDEFYNEAQRIVSNNASSSFPGWSSLAGNTKNRFWLIDNLLSPVFDGIRICYYQYHRQGLDLMFNPAQQKLAKQNIKASLMSLKAVNKKRPNSFLMQLFFDAKSQEIINVFSGGNPIPTADLKEVLIDLDGNNASRYEAIGKG